MSIIAKKLRQEYGAEGEQMCVCFLMCSPIYTLTQSSNPTQEKKSPALVALLTSVKVIITVSHRYVHRPN